MAGGTWLSQNKVRPGAYINFKAVPKSSMTVGDRGIVAIGLSLNWGKENDLIEVLSTDMLDGSSKKLIGFDAFSPESKLLAGALKYCYKALVYRMDNGSTKASVKIGNLTCTAKYAGTFGNNILVAITENKSLFDVVTYVNGETVDSQKVSTISELENNDYVVFSGTGALEANAGSALTGATSGTTSETTAYPSMFAKLKMAKWQVFVCNSSDVSIKSNVVSFINQLRNDEGKYVQGVIPNYDGADDEGIINSVSSVVIDGVTFSVEEFTSIVGGLTAGANFNESNTAKVIAGATSIVNEMNDAEIKNALKSGKFVISTSADGSKVKVEQDINSLHTFTKEKNYAFSKNRVLRTLDEIGTTTKITWEETYEGKVDNDETGRGIFKDDLVAYGTELQRLRGIQEFNGPDDISVVQGNDLDSVLVEWMVKPVDSMEKLYMQVSVNS